MKRSRNTLPLAKVSAEIEASQETVWKVLTQPEITNYATEGTIRVDLEFGIAYNASIEQAKTVLFEVMKEHPRVLQEPQPFVRVLSLGDSAVNLAVRSYVKPQDY